MNLLKRLSIRAHLLILVAVALLPSFAIIAYSGIERRNDSIEDALRRCAELTFELGSYQERVVFEVRQLLTTLSDLGEVRRHDTAACNRLFARILTQNPQFINLHAATTDGRLFASGAPLPGRITIRDRRYFQEAIRTGTFAAGEFIIGRTVNKPMLNFAIPVRDDHDTITATVQAGFDLAFYDRLFANATLPPGAVLVVSDHRGIILYQSGDAELLPGNPESPAILRLMAGPAASGVCRFTSPAGQPAILAYRKLSLTPGAPPYLQIRIAIPEEQIVSEAQSITLRDLLMLFTAAGLTALLAVFYGKVTISGPVDQLMAAVQRLGAGKLSTRTGIDGREGDIGKLAEAFDTMAIALHQREEDLQEANRQAFEEKAKTEAIIAGIGEGISIQSPDYRILFQNEVHREMMGDHLGEFCYQAYERRPAVCQVCPVQMAFADGAIHTVEKRVDLNGEDLYVMITASPIFDDAGNAFAATEVVKDITARKRIELELADKNRRLTESNRELQQFAYVASHDLQEPLRTITSFIQLLARRYQGKLDQDADDFIGFITDGAARMQQLINDLLLYSRVETKGKPFAPTDLNEVLAAVRANLRLAIAENDAVITAAPLPVVTGDKGQLIQLFQNLLANSIRFHSERQPAIEIAATPDDGWWRIEVRDNGIGIDPRFSERIFEIFQRLHGRDDYPGTGIGLAICRKIVERHGGTIRVESAEGNGATFIFTLPA
ncbi:hypothetical protein GURASL_09660 [Geotalea uraniireducens]|uniref:histidine kinase n=1 Tax=Geotalea uraniireducens TaxID=351604 RepID=A0ABN6VPC7_9BACT|nr:ATP-binding protein [Geotalea uraniireducens]BDV42043.1 hypothetical protein GURASL_09660 [Geotalea uraniireducens]